jgi:hypothetical protein
MAESYVRFAKDVEDMTDLQFFERFGEAHRILKYTGLQPTLKAAEELYSLYKRHASQIAHVIERQIKNLAEPIRKGEIRRDSLLGMILGKMGSSNRSRLSDRSFPTPEGSVWQDIKIEIKSPYHVSVSVKEVTGIYTPFEMGFRDRRKIDELNLQWILLLLFADGGNRIGYGTPQQRPMIYKSVQALKKLLKDFFGLTEPPIHNYRRGEGYVAKFYVTCGDECLLDRIRNFEFSSFSDS